MLHVDGNAATGSRWVITKRAVGYRATTSAELEEVRRVLQQPPSGRATRVEHAEDPLVVGERRRVAGGPPPRGEVGNRQDQLRHPEVEREDRPVLRRAVHGGDVAHVGARRLRGAARIARIVDRLVRGHRVVRLPAAEEPEPGIEREQVMDRRRARPGQAHDDERLFDRTRRLGGVRRVPRLDAQAGGETTHDDRFDPGGRVGVADVGRDRSNETFEALLPSVGPEVGDADTLAQR